MAETEIAPQPGSIARGLLRAADRGALATTLVRAGDDAGTWGAGFPYASLVLVATDTRGAPLLLLSDLADHTRNLKADARVALLIDGTAGLDDPLTGARVTLVGRIAVSDDPGARARFLARHPSAERYAGFGDFNLYRLTIGAAHLVAGFGRIHWIASSDLAGPQAPALAEREMDVVGHMNDDHADAIDLYATQLLGQTGGGWRLTGVDAEGADLRRGGKVARLPFAKPVADAEGARVELVRLVKEARRRAAGEEAA